MGSGLPDPERLPVGLAFLILVSVVWSPSMADTGCCRGGPNAHGNPGFALACPIKPHPWS
jgi:hypothetical protein